MTPEIKLQMCKMKRRMSFTAAVHTPSENRLVNENNYRVSAPSAFSHFAKCLIEAYILR